jgi:hypothetical protein
MKFFDSKMLSAALDDSAFPVLDHLMEYFAPEGPYLTFGAPGAARALSLYGRTVLADRDAFADPFNGVRSEGIEVRVAGPEDPLVFPPNRFGLVHVRWLASLNGSTIPNLVRWLKPGGVLLVEAPDDYPARNLPRGPYHAVAEAVTDRLNLPPAATIPGWLIRHGLTHVGCKHELPVTSHFHELLQAVIDWGAPWPDLVPEDLRDWRHDPVATTPALTNVLVWGLKTAR